MESTEEFAQLQLGFVEPIQWRYAVLRPLVLFADRTATQRAHETQTHPETVRTLARRFRQHGMPGLLPIRGARGRQRRALRVPEPVRQEVDRLKALYPGFQYRELARILSDQFAPRLNDKTAKQLWARSSVAPQGQLPLGNYHPQPDRYQARLQVIKRYGHGWEKRSISRFLHVSRPPINAWSHRFEPEHFAGLLDRRRAPQAPPRKSWLPVMVQVYHLQKAHPDAGEFRLWSLLANSPLGGRTVGRIMALNRRVYEDLPPALKRGVKPPAQPHPYTAPQRHASWFIEGRQRDLALDGVKWWSIVLLEGSSRTILAGAIAPTAATWVALMVLYTACLRYGVPEVLMLDSGGAYPSQEFAGVCARLPLRHEPIVRTQGESYKHWRATPFNLHRRLYDYQCSLARSPVALEPLHQTCMQTYNPTAHQGLLKDQRVPPIPVAVLGAAKGRPYTPEALARKFSRALFPRTTNRYGCVTLPSYHCYVEAGLPKTQVLLWVYGEQLRAVFAQVVLAEYSWRYEWRDRKVTAMREGVGYPTRFASPQQALIPLNPQECVVVYRPMPPRSRRPRRSPTRQLFLCELVHTGEGRSA